MYFKIKTNSEYVKEGEQYLKRIVVLESQCTVYTYVYSSTLIDDTIKTKTKITTRGNN